jgi:carbamoyl-phosphate synthase large subunit
MALELGVVGLMNVQMAWQDNELYVIEVNPRASRTVPFVSKAIGISLAAIAARVMAGKTLVELGFTKERIPAFYSVKESVLPFNKFPGVDPILSPEMKSTGEVMGIGETFAEAFGKAALAAGARVPRTGSVILSVKDSDKPATVGLARRLVAAGLHLYATAGTHQVLQAAGIQSTLVNKVKEGRPHMVDLIKNDEVQFIINSTEGRQAIADSATIRHSALQHKVYYTTTLEGALASVEVLENTTPPLVRRLQTLHERAVL